jgi:hypothetical protein
MSRAPWVLLAGDVTALALFGLVGLASHEESASPGLIARSILPFVLAWLAVGAAAGAFGPSAREGRIDAGRLALAWLVAGTLAMVARSIVFDRELITAFFAIGVAGFGLFLGGWRLAYYRLVGSSSHPTGNSLEEGTNG